MRVIEPCLNVGDAMNDPISNSVPERQSIVGHLRSRLSGLMAIYAFGSRVQGTATAESDLDLAVLVEGYVEPLLLWEVAGELADLAGCPVDLLDLRAASTVMQHQVLTGGERWWAADHRAALFEVAMLSEKWDLDRARAGLLADIEKRGGVYGG